MSMYEDLKAKYLKGYVTIDTLKKWVVINDKRPGKGITREEFEDITGTPYEE